MLGEQRRFLAGGRAGMIAAETDVAGIDEQKAGDLARLQKC
jgi:hypothetical protein